MEGRIEKHFISNAILIFIICNTALSQNLENFLYRGSFNPDATIIKSDFQFNGYTNHWHNIHRDEIRYGNLFKESVPDVQMTIAQARIDIADDMKIPGLKVQEGFISRLFSDDFKILDQPALKDLNIIDKNLLILTDPSSECGKILTGKLPAKDEWREKLKSHQYGAKDFTEVNLFYLEKGGRRIFVISSSGKDLRGKALELIETTIELLDKYDLHRGWFGTETLL